FLCQRPPPGRFEGVISFVGSNYGFIERNDLKKFSFSFEAFWGDCAHMIPGVKVRFTLYKDKGKECATDVMIAPGGTEEMDSEIFQGVVTYMCAEKEPFRRYVGCIQTNVFGNEMELPFEERDCRVTLLSGDLVQFCLVTDLVTKRKRAARISLRPDTFQSTKETREMGIIMSIKDNCGSITSEHLNNLHFETKESLDEVDLNVMDEVEFTVVRTTEKTAEIKNEDTSSSYPGLLVFVLEGKENQLPFGAGDVVSEASMLLGDKVQFNISTNRETKAQRAINVEILSDTFQQTKEPREMGTVLDLRESFGFIRCKQDPQLFFHLSEVMEEIRLNLSDKVEFTVLPTKLDGSGLQAVRIKKLPETAFPATPKLDTLSSTNQRHSRGRDQERGYKGGRSRSRGREHRDKGGYSRSYSRDREHRYKGGRSRSHSRGRERRYKGRFSRSHSRDREHRYKGGYSRSYSRDRECRYEIIIQSSRRWHRSRSHDGECSNTSSRKRSQSIDRSSSLDKRSRSPEQTSCPIIDSCPAANDKNKGPLHVPETQELPMSGSSLDMELARKKRELDLLEEQIARRRAIIAMERKGQAQRNQSEEKCLVDKHRLPVEPGNIFLEERISDSLPIKSILKKCSEPLVDLDIQPETDTETAPFNQAYVHQFGFDQPHVKYSPQAQSSESQYDFDQLSLPLAASGQSSCHSYFEEACQPPSEEACLNPHLCDSSVNKINFFEPSVCHPPLARLPQITSKDKSNLSTQIDRFLKTLNKGVDAKLLCSLLHEAREATACYEGQSPYPLQPELLCQKRQYESIHEGRPKQPEGHHESYDFLQPHKKAVQDSSGCSYTTGLNNIPQEHWREGDVQDEQFLHGEKLHAEEHYSEDFVVSNGKLHRASPPPPVEEVDTEEKHNFGKMQTLLKTIGLDLDMAEVSRLADRTEERLYGKKRKIREQGHLDKESEHKIGRMDQQNSQPGPAESNARSICPIMSYPDKLESSSTQGHIARTVQNIETVQTIQDSVTVSLSAPSESQYPHGYDLQTGVTLSNWDCVPPQPETQLYQAYSQHHHSFSYLPSFGQPHPYVSVYSHTSPVFLHTHLPQVPLAAAVESYPGLVPGVNHQSLDAFPLFSNSKKQAGFLKELQSSKSRCLRVIQTVTLKQEKQEKSTALKEVTVHTLRSGSTPPPSEEVASTKEKKVSKISEDDIKAKQKKRLEQFNERMRLKKEQLKAQRTSDESQKPTAGKACKEIKNVWICGHSLVIWAEKRAKSPEYGMQLGMDQGNVRLWWMGRQGLMWEQLFPLLLELKGNWPNPDILVLHLGGNDLGQSDPKDFLDSVKKDLTSVKSVFPQCRLVWSSILPRRTWRTSEDAEAMESIRRTVNESVGAEIQALGGVVVNHEQIRPGSDAGLYRPDGVHLTGKGIDTFNLNLQDFLVKWESEMSQDSMQC
uniref:Uncharacterized LOC108918048 n=1 Tax=Scleropages formosus TaxID=113540 RepID=A0A8C9STL5_SCLFO